MKTVHGFDIPLRELTKEERERPLSLERFREFHYKVGEDFLDSVDTCNIKVFGGWLLHKYPEQSKEILAIMNEEYSEVNSFNELFPYNEGEDIEGIYLEYCEFVNQTEALKARDNQVLIQVSEYYNK